jgi:site-specific DNA-methyltransferase (adenine-specific)
MNTDLMFSNKSDIWYTPRDFFKYLDEQYHFTLDPCCNEQNATCQTFFTEDDDGLSKEWGTHVVFMNPPYSDCKSWMKKAYESSRKGAVVVCLVPSRTDTRWWHEYAQKGSIYFIKGRLKFGGQKNSAPFPSAVIVFDAEKENRFGSIDLSNLNDRT